MKFTKITTVQSCASSVIKALMPIGVVPPIGVVHPVSVFRAVTYMAIALAGIVIEPEMPVGVVRRKTMINNMSAIFSVAELKYKLNA